MSPLPIRYLLAASGVLLALGLCIFLLRWTEHPWLLASLGGSCVILFGMPESEMARPQSLFGGHLIAAVAGLALNELYLRIGGPSEAWQVAAVAIALVLMMLTRTIHSPAGANPIVIFAENADWSFLVAPLAVGLVVLFATQLLVRRWQAASRPGA